MKSALPELAQETHGSELANLLRAAPDRASALIRAALGKAAATAAGIPIPGTPGACRRPDGGAVHDAGGSGIARGIRSIACGLAGSGIAWVIGTIRADFFHRCSEIPGFSALKDGLGSYELLPPTGPEIAQIIREPARAAGLAFRGGR